MTDTSPPNDRWPHYARRLLPASVAIAYVLCIWLANTTREGFDNVIMIWMPAGVALAGLIVLGLRWWPIIAVADVVGHLLFGADPTPYVFMPFSMVTNTAGALLGALLARRILGSDGVTFSQRTCVAVVAGSLVIAVASAPLGVAGLVYSGISPASAYFAAVAKWVAADLFGALLITPPLTLAYGRWRELPSRDAAGHTAAPAEYIAWAFVLLTFAAVLWVMRPDAPQYALGFTGGPLALLIWSAMRFPPLFSAIAALLAGLGLILAVGNELLGFPAPQTHPDSLVLLFFLCTVVVTPLFLAAVQYERRLAAESVWLAKQHLEQRVSERTADLKTSNEQLSKALDELRNTQQTLIEREKLAALGGLVAGVAHEVNTPIGVAMTSSSHLADAAVQLRRAFEAGTLSRSQLVEFIDTTQEAADLAVRNLHRAAELVASFKQVAVDQSTQDRRRFELRTFLTEVLQSMRSLHRQVADVELHCPDDIRMNSYPGPLFQVLSNLLGNAVTHGFRELGERRGRIEIVVDAVDEAQIRLRIQDDGIGMSADVARRAFEPFFTTRRGSGGSGLGLHIVYNLVTGVLGGNIVLHSAPAAGTRFILELPRTPKGDASTLSAHRATA